MLLKKTLEISLAIEDEIGQDHIEVEYDLAIAKIAFQLQYVLRPKLDKIFIRVGLFHGELAFFHALGKLIDGLGLENIMIDAEIIEVDSFQSFISGKNYNRCKRLHPVMSLGL